jgi:hypothetical protein
MSRNAVVLFPLLSIAVAVGRRLGQELRPACYLARLDVPQEIVSAERLRRSERQ